MQSEMGDHGMIHAFRPTYEQVVYRNWPIILNAIPTIRARAGYHDSHAWNRSLDDYAHMVNDALMRYLGSLDEAARDCRAEMHNPFIWLREGTRILIAIPFNLLSWFGILGSATVSGITASHAFKAIAGITGLVGFVGMVAGLIVDVPRAIAEFG
jgi:hypothetical protein